MSETHIGGPNGGNTSSQMIARQIVYGVLARLNSKSVYCGHCLANVRLSVCLSVLADVISVVGADAITITPANADQIRPSKKNDKMDKSSKQEMKGSGGPEVIVYKIRD